MFNFGKKKLIGLDIGSTSIKVAEIDGGRKPTLVSFGMIQTPAGAIASGDIVQVDQLSDAIQELVQQVNIKRKYAATGMWGSSVIVKKISIPRMEEELIGEQLRWEAEQYIPYDTSQVHIDYKILRNIKSESPDAMELLLVAAVQDSVFKVMEIVEMTGLSCSIVDVSGFALANCFEQNYGRTSQPVVLINFGANIISLVIVDSGEVIFSRDIPVGGNLYNAELQKAMGVSPDEAEALKVGASTGQETPQEVTGIIQGTHEIIVDEINNTLDFFANTSNSGDLAQAYITGGGAKTPGFSELFSKTLTCEKLDPFLSIGYKPDVFSRAYMEQIKDYAPVVMGLALRGVDEK